jgi:hypothetical protein
MFIAAFAVATTTFMRRSQADSGPVVWLDCHANLYESVTDEGHQTKKAYSSNHTYVVDSLKKRVGEYLEGDQTIDYKDYPLVQFRDNKVLFGGDAGFISRNFTIDRTTLDYTYYTYTSNDEAHYYRKVDGNGSCFVTDAKPVQQPRF